MANCMSVLHDLEQHPTSLFSSLLNGVLMDGLSCSTWCHHLLPNLSTKSLLHCDSGRTRLVYIILSNSGYSITWEYGTSIEHLLTSSSDINFCTHFSIIHFYCVLVESDNFLHMMMMMSIWYIETGAFVLENGIHVCCKAMSAYHLTLCVLQMLQCCYC